MKKKFLISFLAILLIVISGGVYFFYSTFNRMQRVELPVNEEELGITPKPVEDKKNEVLNIAFFGLDARDPDVASRSDSIMVVSINKKNQTVKVTSLMRDMYVPIPSKMDNRINAAYAVGGPALALKTINSNFNLDIKNFVTVNFFGLEDLIDKIGGVTIDVKPNEVSHAQVKKSGVQVLNGKQAVAYARIRYVGNSDYERTERQRRIINEIFKTIKSQGPLKLVGTVNTLLPYVETNLSNGEIISIASDAINFKSDSIEQYRLPVDGTFRSERIREMAVLVPDLEANKQKLHEFIYGPAENLSVEGNVDVK